MLRSIFSLIQRIIDSDKKYNNTKSKAVIYCFTNPNNTINMDLEIDGKTKKSLKNIQYNGTKPIEKGENSFQIKTDQEGEKLTLSNSIEQVSANKAENTIKDVSAEDIVAHFPKKRIEVHSKEKDQVASLLEQIQKMKTGLERLQEIALQFNCSESFGEDINLLVSNAKNSLHRSGKENNIFPKS
ncbi:hypothetical protein GWI33_004686 [Rhynchophorus ferrugineus]|uniref:Uncharacterized protein n=1 Tax=Rhynchophorus ferrugineus TaxID=354439 RepID=A0A834IWJ8_RHYFE|nr:hypothetical protein GWI33_004686 [Rhynchophorus ferrugineus]